MSFKEPLVEHHAFKLPDGKKINLNYIFHDVPQRETDLYPQEEFRYVAFFGDKIVDEGSSRFDKYGEGKLSCMPGWLGYMENFLTYHNQSTRTLWDKTVR